jgi:hypothetical protein
MSIREILETRAGRGKEIGSAALMSRIESDLPSRRRLLAHPGLGFIAAAVVTLAVVGGVLIALRPDSNPVPPADTSTTTTIAPQTTTTRAEMSIELSDWIGTYTWTEYVDSVDPAVEQDLTGNDVLVHDLELTVVAGGTLTGHLTQNGHKIDRYVEVVATPSGEFLNVFATQGVGPYGTDSPLFQLSGDPARPVTTIGQLETLRLVPHEGDYFERPLADQGEEALANRQFVWNFQPGVDDPERLRTVLETYDGSAYDLIHLVADGDQATRDVVFEYLKRPSVWSVQTLALMERYGAPGGNSENPEPWPGDVRAEIGSALQDASQATFGEDAELAVDLQLDLAEQNLERCVDDVGGCNYGGAWYAVPEVLFGVDHDNVGPVIAGTIRTTSDTGGGGEFPFSALYTDTGWQLIDGIDVVKPFVSISGPSQIVTNGPADLGGYADPAAQLTVAGQYVDIDQVTGRWTAPAWETAPDPGWHDVEVTATMHGDTNTASVRIRYVPDAVGQFAFMRGLDTSGDRPALVVDYAEFLTGDEGVMAAVDDGELLDPDAGLPNGFYISNNDPELRTLPLADDAVVYLFDYATTSEFRPHRVSIDDLVGAFESEDDNTYYYSLTNYPVWLTIKDDTILQVTPQYIP